MLNERKCNPEFLKLLKDDELCDVETLVNYRDDFINLAYLLNEDVSIDNSPKTNKLITRLIF